MRNLVIGLLGVSSAALLAACESDPGTDAIDDSAARAFTAGVAESPADPVAGPITWRVRRIGAGFNQPLFLAGVPDGSGRVFVVEKEGLIRILNPATGGVDPVPFLDVSAEISTGGERGLLGFATAPDFATSGRFYVYLTAANGDSEIRRYRTLAGDPDHADPDSGNRILTFAQSSADNHKGGWLGFGPEDYLYLASGDGGPGGDPNNTAQDTNLFLGKILRIDPGGDQFPGNPLRDYRIPPDNPFVGGGGRPEIWAYGLRNPFRASFDRQTGNLFIGDVGQSQREEIDFMRPQDGGANFGWSILEGDIRFKPGDASGMIAPSIVYKRGSQPRRGNVVTGGYVYRGPVPELRGLYFFIDFGTDNLWTIDVSDFHFGHTLPKGAFRNRNDDFQPNTGTIDSIASFGEDQAGNLYLVGIDGEIFRIEPL
ncbi:MAG: PQQ-dependent sugar dehydrogenase [Sphingomonadaceae bacterium]|nr:PQQ-dependent sugar dehydrogenase [Sphingomonadaceae bacterium]